MLLFLNRCYWPDTEATGQLLTDLCESLAVHQDVHVICGQPNSPAPGETFCRVGTQQRNGVTIHRLAHTRFAKRIPAGRILNLLSFTRAANRYLKRSRLQPTWIVCETDPFLLPIVGAKHAQRNGARLISYLQDIYPDVAEAIGKAKSGWLTRQIRHSLRRAYSQSTHVIVLGECMKRRLASAPWGVDAAKLTVIPNWADCATVEPTGRASNRFITENELADRFVVMHSGNMGMTQRLDVLLSAVAHPDWPDRAILLLVGDGADRNRLETLARDLPKDRVRLLPYQPRESLSESLSAADLHVVSMHESITGCLCPSKLYGILAVGRPVLAIASLETDLCETVQEYKIGATCPPGDASSIAKAVQRLSSDLSGLEEMGVAARQLALKKFDRLVIAQAFHNLLTAT